mmetsp:Transcript_76908/g.198065  ORF Transcript_76908/g.198065 Transcript_76908/m.198065 type:complete len:343 (+) Transcript_76908:106-1134(+)
MQTPCRGWQGTNVTSLEQLVLYTSSGAPKPSDRRPARTGTRTSHLRQVVRRLPAQRADLVEMLPVLLQALKRCRCDIDDLRPDPTACRCLPKPAGRSGVREVHEGVPVVLLAPQTHGQAEEVVRAPEAELAHDGKYLLFRAPPWEVQQLHSGDACPLVLHALGRGRAALAGSVGSGPAFITASPLPPRRGAGLLGGPLRRGLWVLQGALFGESCVDLSSLAHLVHACEVRPLVLRRVALGHVGGGAQHHGQLRIAASGHGPPRSTAGGGRHAGGLWSPRLSRGVGPPRAGRGDVGARRASRIAVVQVEKLPDALDQRGPGEVLVGRRCTLHAGDGGGHTANS